MTPVANGSQPPPDFSGLRKAVEGMRSKIAASILPIPMGQAGDIVGVMDALRKHLSTATPEHAEAVKHWCAGTFEGWVVQQAGAFQKKLLSEFVNSLKSEICARLRSRRRHNPVRDGSVCSCEELFNKILERVAVERPAKFNWAQPGSYHNWVVSVAYNLQGECLDREDTRKRYGSGSAVDLNEVRNADELTTLEAMIAAEEKAEAEAKKQRELDALRECVKTLTPIERLVYEMDIHQQRPKEIPAVAVWTREDTVRQMLRSRRPPGDIATTAHHGLRDFANQRAQQGQPITDFADGAGQSLQRLRSELGDIRTAIDEITEVNSIDEVDKRIRAKVHSIRFHMHRKLKVCVERRVKQ